MSEFPRTERTTVRRLPNRGSYERDVIYAILDEGLVCHVAFALDGQPYLIPTMHARLGDTLYLHGSPANHMLRSLEAGIEACVAVTLLDGLVMARSAFHHSMNYRSAVVFGVASPVTTPEEKVAALQALVEHVATGRWGDVRRPTEKELRGTLVLGLPLEEASAKIRTGPPIDEEEDYGLPLWAGVVPLRQQALPPTDDPRLGPSIEAPPYAVRYRRPRADT